jgi:hypothetical protein
MKIINFDRRLLRIGLTLWLVSASSHAEIYKWVDANGQTHYSERKDDAGKAKALDIKVRPEPAQAASGSPQYWQDQERQFRQRQAERSAQKPESPVDKRPKSLSGGKIDETDASKCNLARDILSGAVEHSNGAPTDPNDRHIAESDIRRYCR